MACVKTPLVSIVSVGYPSSKFLMYTILLSHAELRVWTNAWIHWKRTLKDFRFWSWSLKLFQREAIKSEQAAVDCFSRIDPTPTATCFISNAWGDSYRPDGSDPPDLSSFQFLHTHKKRLKHRAPVAPSTAPEHHRISTSAGWAQSFPVTLQLYRVSCFQGQLTAFFSQAAALWYIVSLMLKVWWVRIILYPYQQWVD